jgi:MOSC domain-containing protein YiiM
MSSSGCVVAVNVGVPREVEWKGRRIQTAIFKEQVEHTVAIRRLNLDGDRQADLSVHGGPAKAVYAYPAEHYEPWRAELPELELSFGMFGENVTVAGLSLEDEIFVGDRVQIGTAELLVAQPRLPCFKLGLRFGRDDILKRFLRSGRTGYYLAVAAEGEVGACDEAVVLERHPARVPVSEVTRVYAGGRTDQVALRRLSRLESLPEDWRRWAAQQLEHLDGARARSGVRAPSA